MFGSSDPNTPAPSVPQGHSPIAGEFGSTDPNPVPANSPLDQHEYQKDSPMPNVEGLQGPGDTSYPNPVDESMHDAHAEVGLGQKLDTEPLQVRGVDLVGEGNGKRGGPTEMVEASKYDQGEVIH